ncbi:hypothetical protein QR680_004844 [Steinernema hermaphroditum]|uniref:Uncharacterized protein n=1 Tax=Steinernema hermaphroditum TaxID=289476 RepID=A0AA39HS90_9BILA|nr:hypothetical protein QR680_004844 [Steinernema hermaphroditum]
MKTVQLMLLMFIALAALCFAPSDAQRDYSYVAAKLTSVQRHYGRDAYPTHLYGNRRSGDRFDAPSSAQEQYAVFHPRYPLSQPQFPITTETSPMKSEQSGYDLLTK